MNFLRQLFRGVQDAWQRLSASARVNIVLAGAASVAVIAMVAWFGSRPQYVTLSAGLTPESASQIVEVLNQNGIDWREEGNYNRILIPADNRSEVQLLLAEAQLPVGETVPPGFEIFDQTSLMTNQWLQNVQLVRALQGELQKQLNAFDFVDASYVLLREAPDELFQSEQKNSEAAVTLKTNRELSKREIKALVSLIGRAGGANLDQNHITITSTEGDPIWLPAQDGFSSIANNKLDMTTEWESQRESKIQSKLRDMGIRGTVAVSAQIDFDETEVTTEKVAEGTELSTYTTETKSTTTQNPAAGAPGARANVPESTPEEGESIVTDTTTEEISNFEPSVTRSTTKSQPGDIKGYSVALIVESEYKETTAADGTTTKEPVPLDDEQKAALESFVLAAVGEGDQPTKVTIHDMPLRIDQLGSAMETVETVARSEQWDYWMQLAGNAGQIMLILIGFLLVRRFVRRAISRPPEEEEEEPMAEIPEATREDLRRQEVSSEISGLAAREPDSVAALLRSWMTEDEE